MLTANRFDEIKTFLRDVHQRTEQEDAILDVGAVVEMLSDVVKEVERIRSVPNVPPARPTNVKPLVLGADGKPILGPPISQQLAVERREQYAIDRREAVERDARGNLDPRKWRLFCLRWGNGGPPPGGWENTAPIILAMHRIRLTLDDVPHIEKHWSAVALTSQGIALPPGMTLRDGVLDVGETKQG